MKKSTFKDRILAEPFVEWKKLPELVATVDISYYVNSMQWLKHLKKQSNAK